MLRRRAVQGDVDGRRGGMRWENSGGVGTEAVSSPRRGCFTVTAALGVRVGKMTAVNVEGGRAAAGRIFAGVASIWGGGGRSSAQTDSMRSRRGVPASGADTVEADGGKRRVGSSTDFLPTTGVDSGGVELVGQARDVLGRHVGRVRSSTDSPRRRVEPTWGLE